MPGGALEREGYQQTILGHLYAEAVGTKKGGGGRTGENRHYLQAGHGHAHNIVGAPHRGIVVVQGEGGRSRNTSAVAVDIGLHHVHIGGSGVLKGKGLAKDVGGLGPGSQQYCGYDE